MGMIIIDRMLKRVDEENLKKEEWEPDILALEATLSRYLNEKGYRYEEKNYLEEKPDENFRLLSEKEKMAYENPVILLPEGTKAAYAKLNDFLDSYHIGFIHDFMLNQNGMFAIELSLHIHSPSTGLGRNDVAEKANFEAGIRRLKELGMTLVKNGGFNIPSTEANKKIILDILRLFCEPRLVRFHIREDIYDKISFLVSPESIKEPQLITKEPVTDEMIKQDKLIRIKRLVKEMYYAIGSINSMPHLANICGYIIEGCFSEICDLLGIETELTRIHHGRHARTRAINSAINEMEKELGTVITMEQITPLTKALFETIGTELRERIGYRLNEGTGITIYKGLRINADCIPSCSYYDAYLLDDGDIEEHAAMLCGRLEKMFDMVEPFPDERYVAFTEKNLDIIVNCIHNVYHSEIENILIENKKGELYIKSFSFYIDDISTCL